MFSFAVIKQVEANEFEIIIIHKNVQPQQIRYEKSVKKIRNLLSEKKS